MEKEDLLSPSANLKDDRRKEDRMIFKHKNKNKTNENISEFMVELSDDRTKDEILEEIRKMQQPEKRGI